MRASKLLVQLTVYYLVIGLGIFIAVKIWPDLRGFSWWAPGAEFTTALGPNSSSPDIVTQNCNNLPAQNLPCVDNGGAWNIIGARSRHAGGVNAAMCDGSVRFVPNAIDINIWRALSTTRGGEVISSQ